MRSIFSQLSVILQRRAKRSLVLATIGSIVVGLLDGLGLVLILPLVNLATGQGQNSTVVQSIRSALGEPSTQTLTLALSVVCVAADATG